MRSSRSAKPSASSTTVTTSGESSLYICTSRLASSTRASARRRFSRASRRRSRRRSSWICASSARLASRLACSRTCLVCSTVMSDCRLLILLREGADLRGQHALAALVLLDLRAAAIDLLAAGSLWPLEPSGSTAHRASGMAATRSRRLSRRPMRRAMLGALRPGTSDSAPRYGACNESCRMQGFYRVCATTSIPLSPTGLADGLANVRYAVIRPRFAPERPRFPRSTGWSPVDSASRNLPAIAALKKLLKGSGVCHHLLHRCPDPLPSARTPASRSGWR